MMPTAIVNKIIPVSSVDGPGNRTTIFLQGCNIQCGYCHNPETQRICNNCGRCVKECPTRALTQENGQVIWDEVQCILCDRCINVCENYASPRVKKMTARQVFEEIEKGISFIRGITVSGGECTLYPEFLIELFQLAKANQLTCLIDSNGTTDFEEQKKLLELCDGVLLDIKSWDKNIYQALTGGDNAVVKKNLKLFAKNGKLAEIRIVCLPEKVDAKNAVKEIADMLGSSCIHIKLKLIKFRKFGVKGVFSGFESPDDNYMDELKEYAKEVGFHKIVIT
jgi:pyruvate formate lyase activating enzyme